MICLCGVMTEKGRERESDVMIVRGCEGWWHCLVPRDSEKTKVAWRDTKLRFILCGPI